MGLSAALKAAILPQMGVRQLINLQVTKRKGISMIDAREQVRSSPLHRRQRSKPTAVNRSRATAAKAQKTLPMERVFSDKNVKPFDQIEWDKRTAEITDDTGKVIFKQTNVEVPKSWSELPT